MPPENPEARTQILAFDIYGTILDTSAVASELKKYAPDDAAEIAKTWQTSSSQDIPFDEVTRRSLLHATTEHGLTLAEDALSSLNAAYRTLPAFPDARPALVSLQKLGVEVVIFSNGTSDMVNTALEAESLLPYARKHVLVDTLPLESTADGIRKYKPAREVYRGLLRCVGREEHPADVWLISGNPFDVTGARSCGLRAIWVDRSETRWTDHLLDRNTRSMPTYIVRHLNEIVEVVQAGGLALTHI